MRIYIAGRVTGIEEEAEVRFAAAEQMLSEHHEVVNPMKLPHDHGKTWKEYLSECIKHLLDCDAVFLLNNWYQSKGARLEYMIASRLDMPFYYESNYQQIKPEGVRNVESNG